MTDWMDAPDFRAYLKTNYPGTMDAREGKRRMRAVLAAMTGRPWTVTQRRTGTLCWAFITAPKDRRIENPGGPRESVLSSADHEALEAAFPGEPIQNALGGPAGVQLWLPLEHLARLERLTWGRPGA